MRKKTNEQFLEEVRQLVGEEYTFLEPYQGARTRIKVRHNMCGNTYLVTPDNFLRGKRCPKEQKKPREKLANKLQAACPEYIHLVRSGLSKSPALFECSKCGNMFWRYPAVFLRQSACPICNHDRVFWDTETFKRYVTNTTNGEYELVSEYHRTNENVTILHKVCGHKYQVMPLNFLKGDRCPHETNQRRGDGQRFDTEQAQKRLDDFYNGEYVLQGEYHAAKEKIRVLHKKCGRIFDGTYDNLIHGHGCPVCNESSGERDVERWLTKHGYRFERQKAFQGCAYRGPLLFDFYLPDTNQCIEYDGEQHFEPIEYFGGIKKFKLNQKRDGIKNDYCKKAGIDLVRIKYTESVDDVLSARLR